MIRERATFLVCMAVWSLLAGCAARERPVTAVTIVADPGPFDSIEEAAAAEARVHWWDDDRRDDDACTVAYAAEELRRFLPLGLGVPASAVRVASALPDTGDVVLLGFAKSRTLGDFASDSAPAPQGYHLREVGRDGRRVIVIEGGDRAGVLYGAYALLEHLGVTFPGLGDTGRVTPERPSAWPPRLDRRDSPAVPVRGFWAFEPRGDRTLFEWMARNRLNQWTAVDSAHLHVMKKLGFALTGGGHDVQALYLSPSRYFAAHPEWYGWHDGRRSPNLRGESGDNFCTSNADARGMLASNLTRALIEGAFARVDRLELWMLDGGRWCECNACAAQGAFTDRLLDVAQEVADSIEAARAAGALRRPVTLSTHAYLETMGGPQRRHGDLHGVEVTFFPYFRCYAHALEDSTCLEINRRVSSMAWNVWRAWHASEGSGSLGVCEYWNVGAFKSLPLIFPHVMARDLRKLVREGTLTRLEYMHAPARAWGSWTLHHALFTRLAWDPDQDPDTLIARHVRAYFPGAAQAMREHYGALEIASANILALQHCVGVYGTSTGGRLTQPDAPIFPLQHLQSHEVHSPANDGPDLDEIKRAVMEAAAALDRARGMTRDPLEAARLAEEARRFDYGRAMFEFWIALIRTVESEREGDRATAKASFAAADRAASTLRTIKDLVQVSASHANARDGLEASGVVSTYEALRRRYAR